MLEHTNCHVPGIGPKIERRLWSSGVLSWRDVTGDVPSPLSPRRAQRLQSHIDASVAHLADNNPDYFCERLPSDQHWRMFPDFRHAVAYLDIETTGLGPSHDYITTIALYDGQSIYHYVQGDNLPDFMDDIGRYRLLVTYNGKSFDVPFIRSYFGISMKQAHIDLRYVLASLGYRGGLKGCEKQLGIDREELDGIDGYFAVLLWRDFHRSGNERALETLLAYNIEDVVNLEMLMVHAYNLKLKKTPFVECCRLPNPRQPESPFRADMETVERIKRERGW